MSIRSLYLVYIIICILRAFFNEDENSYTDFWDIIYVYSNFYIKIVFGYAIYKKNKTVKDYDYIAVIFLIQIFSFILYNIWLIGEVNWAVSPYTVILELLACSYLGMIFRHSKLWKKIV